MATRISPAADVMRKRPVQARSRATIAAILDATAHILAAGGWATLNTNAVAERAGVSIGSLYQYFPDKVALADAVRARHFDQLDDVLKGMADPAATPARRTLALVDGMIAAHSGFPGAHAALLEAPSSPAGEAARAAFARRYGHAFERFVVLNARRVCARPADTAMVLAAALAGAVHEGARAGRLGAASYKAELVMLVDGLLGAGAAR